MSNFVLDIEILISRIDSRPMLWNKTDDVSKDRTVIKKVLRYVRIGLRKTLKYQDLFTTTIQNNIPIIELRSIADRCAYTATWSPSLVFRLAGENRRCY